MDWPTMNFILNPSGGKRTTVTLRLRWIKIYQPWSRYKVTLCESLRNDFLSRTKFEKTHKITLTGRRSRKPTKSFQVIKYISICLKWCRESRNIENLNSDSISSPHDDPNLMQRNEGFWVGNFWTQGKLMDWPTMNFILNPSGGKRTTVILRLAWIKIYQSWSRHNSHYVDPSETIFFLEQNLKKPTK
jgi:hypothetical protein